MKQILLFILLPLEILAQNTIAFPDIVNFPKQIYKAGLQNWDIKQDKFGKMYFANNEGLLCFDGKYWNNYPLPNKTNVRSVEISEKNKTILINERWLILILFWKINMRYKVFGVK